MTEPGRCAYAGCPEPAVTTLDSQGYCRAHFISLCYEKIDHLSGWQSQPSRSVAASSVRAFLDECIPQVEELSAESQKLDNLERARLLDILSRSREIGRHLRRSPRTPLAIPVILRSETPGRPWEEDTQTVILSRYGALVQCRNLVRARDTLVVVRQDTHQEARAQVVWRRRKRDGVSEMGIEFLNTDNFWQLDWNRTESMKPASPSFSPFVN